MDTSKLSFKISVFFDLIKYFWQTQKPFMVAGIITISYFISLYLLFRCYNFSTLTPAPTIDSFVIVYTFPIAILLFGFIGLIGFIVEVILLWMLIYKLLKWFKKIQIGMSPYMQSAILKTGIALYVGWLL